MNIEKMLNRESEITKEINSGDTSNLNELLEISFNFWKHYNRI